MNDASQLPSEETVVNLGKSSCHAVGSESLRMINSDDSFFSLKEKESCPISMEVNWGKSIHNSPFLPFTLKHCTNTIMEYLITTSNRSQLR